MGRGKQVHRANIDPKLRSSFEKFGYSVLADALAAGELSSKGDELNKLFHEHRSEIVDWLREKREEADQREIMNNRWTVAGTVAAIIAAIFSGIAAWFTVWPRH